jgi:hypothetical protein
MDMPLPWSGNVIGSLHGQSDLVGRVLYLPTLWSLVVFVIILVFLRVWDEVADIRPSGFGMQVNARHRLTQGSNESLF